ncbi:hypothetical protein niasHT_021536 [Heterodera trifolii]|uniref:Uncharacterized protein n=1 Tax=Heterodera trifolii TaxID=157864 RepID=A0ABD2K153_9BILA
MHNQQLQQLKRKKDAPPTTTLCRQSTDFLGISRAEPLVDTSGGCRRNLRSLVYEACGVWLDKSLATADWTRRLFLKTGTVFNNFQFILALHFNQWHFVSINGTLLHSMALHFTQWHFTSLNGTSFHSMALQFIQWHFISLIDTSIHSMALHSTQWHFIPPNGTSIHSMALHFTHWHFNSLNGTLIHTMAFQFINGTSLQSMAL